SAPYQSPPKPQQKQSRGGSFLGTFLVMILSVLIGIVVGAIAWNQYGSEVLLLAGISQVETTPSPTPSPTPTVTVSPTADCIDGATECESWATYNAAQCNVDILIPQIYKGTAATGGSTVLFKER